MHRKVYDEESPPEATSRWGSRASPDSSDGPRIVNMRSGQEHRKCGQRWGRAGRPPLHRQSSRAFRIEGWDKVFSACGAIGCEIQGIAGLLHAQLAPVPLFCCESRLVVTAQPPASNPIGESLAWRPVCWIHYEETGCQPIKTPFPSPADNGNWTSCSVVEPTKIAHSTLARRWGGDFSSLKTTLAFAEWRQATSEAKLAHLDVRQQPAVAQFSPDALERQLEG